MTILPPIFTIRSHCRQGTACRLHLSHEADGAKMLTGKDFYPAKMSRWLFILSGFAYF
jgi:hypothetical protein